MVRRSLVLLALVALAAVVVLAVHVEATSAAPAPAAAAAKGAAKAKAAKKAAIAKKKAKPFDDFGLSKPFAVPKGAIRVRGNARTHRLKLDKLVVHSRLPLSSGTAKKSAGICKKGKCTPAQKAAIAKLKAKAKKHGKGKGKHHHKDKKHKKKIADEVFPPSALPPVPFTPEQIKAAKARAAAEKLAAQRAAEGHAFLEIDTDEMEALSAEENADADAEADTLAEEEAEDGFAAADAAESEVDAEANAEAEAEADAEADAEAEAEAEAEMEAETDSESESEVDADAEAEAEAAAEKRRRHRRRRRHHKKRGKKHAKKHHKKQKKHRKRVPVLVSRPSALVRRHAKAKSFKALRAYARRVSTKHARIHVITPHRRTRKVTITTGKGKHRRTVTTTKLGPKRKIELAALLHVTGNVVFGKKPAKHHKKGKGKGKGTRKGKNAKAAKHAASGPAFIEDMMVVSRRASGENVHRANSASAVAHASSLSSEHEYHHQWRLVYDDVNDGWRVAPHQHTAHAAYGAPITAKAALAAPMAVASCHALRGRFAASPVPTVVPSLAFGGSHAPSSVIQTFGDLPEHSLVAVSGTFHFIGAWNGEVGTATVDGAPAWMDTFAADPDADASYPQQHAVRFRVVLPHTRDEVAIGLGATLAPKENACWAVDDVAVSVLH